MVLPLPPARPAEPVSFLDRVRSGAPLLGAVARGRDELALAARVELDFVAVPVDVVPPPGVPALALVGGHDLAAVPDGVAGVLVGVGSVEQVRAVVSAARHGWAVLAVGAPGLAEVEGVDAVVVLVPDAPAARTALATGSVAAYDLAVVLDAVADGLGSGRPDAVVTPDREPLVLVSGMLGDATLWDAVSARLGDLVLPWPARIDLDDSVTEMAATVLAAAPARFALAGHSLGAIVALEIVRQAPHRVTRLVVVNASARGPVAAQQQAWSAMHDRTMNGGFAEVAAELARATLAASRRDDSDLVTANGAMAHAVGADGFVRQLAAQGSRPDSLDSLAAITVPVLVVSGRDDEICPPALQQELVDRCPSAELVTLPGGHMLPLENPVELADALRARLARQ